MTLPVVLEDPVLANERWLEGLCLGKKSLILDDSSFWYGQRFPRCAIETPNSTPIVEDRHFLAELRHKSMSERGKKRSTVKGSFQFNAINVN